jgi:hypothetical protein
LAEESNEARALVERGAVHEHLAALGWCAVLRRALGRDAHVELAAPDVDREGREGRELTVTLRADSGGTATFGFGKSGAAAVLSPLLRSGALGRSSTPDAVARVLGDLLAREATALWGSGVHALARPLRTSEAARLVLTVELGWDRFEVSLWLDVPGVAPLAEACLELPLFVAVSSALRAELDGLREGDLWYPESGWLVAPDALFAQAARSGEARPGAPTQQEPPALALLGTPGDTSATWVALQNGSLVLTGPRTTLGVLCSPQVESGVNHAALAASPHLLEAWCVASVELGHVRLTAEEASTLRVGGRLALRSSATARLWMDHRVCADGDLERHDDGWALHIRRVLPRPPALELRPT